MWPFTKALGVVWSKLLLILLIFIVLTDMLAQNIVRIEKSLYFPCFNDFIINIDKSEKFLFHYFVVFRHDNCLQTLVKEPDLLVYIENSHSILNRGK